MMIVLLVFTVILITLVRENSREVKFLIKLKLLAQALIKTFI
jgi:hypothetical protein